MSAARRDLYALEELAVELAAEAGTLIVDRRSEEMHLTTKSSATDVVTVMDRYCEQMMRRRLTTERSGDAILGEEHGIVTNPSKDGLTWVLDPIDGTVNYVYHLGHFAVSVAVVEGDPRVPGGWRPLAGAVSDPSGRRIYHARRGGGSYRRRFEPGADQPVAPRVEAVTLRVTQADSLAASLIGTGFSYVAQERREQAVLLVDILPAVRDIRRMGSAALDLCAVAEGSLDGYYEQGLNAWDYAAGWLMVTEAGGQVSGWCGRPPADPGLVAGGATVHRDLSFLLDGLLGDE